MTLGTTINGWIFEHLWAGGYRRHVGPLIRHWNEHDPSWIDRIVAANVAGKRWALPSRMLSWRLHNLKGIGWRSEEHTSELQSLMRNSYAVLCLKKKKKA